MNSVTLPRLPARSLAGNLFALVLLATHAAGARADDSELEFFEAEVRPVLVERCSGCHGSAEQSGGLRVDLRDRLLAGGDSGAAVVPGNVAESLLVKAVRHTDGLEMPPDEELSEREIAALERWIARGAPWPELTQPLAGSSHGLDTDHWAFQAVQQPAIPTPEGGADWIRTPVDAFILAKLQDHSLAPAPPADRRSLIRRVCYSLTGLPPTAAEVEQFVRDDSPNAYADLVDGLLARTQYGEHWARHWLDVARYSDTKGYVYAREERFWVHAWTYRDWVVSALNEDMPYDRFLLLQLAADQVEGRRTSDLAAMGFLTLGRRFLGVERDIIDDRIDVVCRGTMGLSVACARCHDHKYDPIPTADYYSLYGVFDSCVERLEPLDEASEDEAFAQELDRRQTALSNQLAAFSQESADRVRGRVGDYLFAQSELHKYPANGFDQVFQKEDILPAFVRRWERYLRDAGRNGDPIFADWHAYAQIPAESFAAEAVNVTRQLGQLDSRHPWIAEAFATPPSSFLEVCERYEAIFAQVDEAWRAHLAAASEADQPSGEPSLPSAGDKLAVGLEDPQAEALRRVLYGPQAPCEVPAGPVVLSETYFDSGSLNELWKLQGEVDRWIINAPTPAPHALTLVDQAVPLEPRVFVRGNPLTQGEDVPRQFLAALSGDQRRPFQQGSGRYELARAIIDPGNSLTARVIVNRVWTAHFGQGLVSTPSDFGTRAETPSHPELLDWLASNLVAHGWSLKQLHRWIVLSSTYQQSSRHDGHEAAAAVAIEQDPENRLLWRMNPKRLSFEEFRDALLAASGDLDEMVGGRPRELFSQPFPHRRTLYGLVDRQFLPGTFRMFDFANPDLHIPQRSETTVPGQALFFLNHPLMRERARALAASVQEAETPAERVAAMFRQVLQRQPTPDESSDALAMIASVAEQQQEPPSPTRADWQYGYGALEESTRRTAGFTPLPHFTGKAWQGGDSHPDATLGWVQLTAEGGHPGNDRAHAAIRRWTAPRAGIFSFHSRLQHEPTAGDGIRAFVVHSAAGVLASENLQHDTRELNVTNVEIAAGDTLDFVVDIGDELNSDQYLWSVSIHEVLEHQSGTEGELPPAQWDSAKDFPSQSVEQLDAWEQLAQVLLCSNEFMFVD